MLFYGLIFTLIILTLFYIKILIDQANTYFGLSNKSQSGSVYFAERHRRYAIQLETQEEFDNIVKNSYEALESGSNEWNMNFNGNGIMDDYMEQRDSNSNENKYRRTVDELKAIALNVPGNEYWCKHSYITIRSEVNYKYLWMHGREDYTMSATASMDTPLYLKTFEVIPVDAAACESTSNSTNRDVSNGYVLLKQIVNSAKSGSGFDSTYIMMVPPLKTIADLVAESEEAVGGQELSRNANAESNLEEILSNGVEGGKERKLQAMEEEYGAATVKDDDDLMLKGVFQPTAQPTAKLDEGELKKLEILRKYIESGDGDGEMVWTVQNSGSAAVGHKSKALNMNALHDDPRYHWLLENDGFLYNRASNAYINVFSQNDHVVRGHASRITNPYGFSDTVDIGKYIPSRKEYSGTVVYEHVDEKKVFESLEQELLIASEKEKLEKEYISQIQNFPSSTKLHGTDDKWVISYGLYGNSEKYTAGALKNVELAKIYYPNWICRFYVASDVDAGTIQLLQSHSHVEVVRIPEGEGEVAGMFWRFMVAADPKVERYLVRDTDSRLSARERMAVEEWIAITSEPDGRTKLPIGDRGDNDDTPYIHIMRDHVNHCIVMNGGMWGGIRGAIPDFKKMIDDWVYKDSYSSDLHFLEEMVWPLIIKNQMAHDSYCCDHFDNASPFPTKRSMLYEHVGQVFSALDQPRLNDIDGYIRGLPTPSACRKQPDWIYG